MAKLEILNSSEQIIFDAPPALSHNDQNNYFRLPAELIRWLDGTSNLTNKVGFILMWGYCQLGARFYQPGQFHVHDLKAVCQQYGFDDDKVKLTDYNQRTFNYHKQIIRKHLGLQPFDNEAKTFFMECIQDRIIRCYSPKQRPLRN